MPYRVEYDGERDLVVLEYEGTVDTATAQEGATVASDAAFRQDTNRVLVDLRDADLALSADDMRGLPAAISDALAEWSIPVRAFRRAIVVSDRWEDYRLFEQVATGEGWTTRVFDSVDEARKWLAQD
jgi:hypothetical protein